ncbi:hypothetical protein BHE74_00020345 [Ensete ventricosum]|nr:hypothetical protein BHE74_00020345 [Ensete ventricosum]
MLARPRSSRCGVGARSDGWNLEVRLGKSVTGMVELGSAVRPLTPPYLCQTDFPVSGRPRGGPVVRGHEDGIRSRGRTRAQILGIFAERKNSGTNPGDLAKRVNSGTNPGDFAERANSGTNPWDSAEMMHSGTNPGDLAEDAFGLKSRGSGREDGLGHKSRGSGREDALGLKSRGSGREGTYLGTVGMTSSDSSSSVRVVSSPRSGEASQCDPEVGSSGASSGPPSLVDARVLWDLEVMKADHDLDTAVTEGSLAVIRERYSIPVEYGLHVPQPRQRPYSSDAPGMCISVDALEAGLRFPLHPLIEECLRWWRISPSQVAPNSWRYLVVFLGYRGGYYLAARVGFRVSGTPSNNKGWKSRYLFVSGPVWRFRLDWSTHPIGNASPYLSEESVLVGRLKGILSSSCAIKEMTELWLVEAGLSLVLMEKQHSTELWLARFHARHPNSEVEEDPFTIHPEDDLVLMEKQKAFDDSDPPEP